MVGVLQSMMGGVYLGVTMSGGGGVLAWPCCCAESYEGLEYRLVDLHHDTEPLRRTVPDRSMDLPPNPLAEPDLASATRHQVVLNGGMMMQMMMEGDPGGMMDQ